MTIKNDRPKVLVLGTGPIGAIYAYLFHCANSQVTTVCRSNYDAISSNGIRILSQQLGQVSFTPHAVVRDVRDCDSAERKEFDYVLVTTKAVSDDSTLLDALQLVLSPRTVIVLIQNGIGIEAPYASRFPEQVVSSVVYLPSEQVSPGVFRQNGPDLLEVGHFPARPPSASLQTFAEVLERGGGKVVAVEDVQRCRWKKALINACWNPIAALTLNRDAEFIGCDEGAMGLCRAIMLEILSVAHQEGYHDLTEVDIERQLDRAVQRSKVGKGIKMSMLADVESGRELEVEAIIGNPLRMGRQHGLALPRLEMLYLLIKGRAQAASRLRQDQ